MMAVEKIQKAGVSFAIGKQSSPIVIEVRPNHDTISSLKGVRLGFELLNGITPVQAKKIVDTLNENLVGLVAVTAPDDKAEAASG
jgi:hypothetical protein